MERLDIFMERLKKFVHDRDWEQFHSPSNLAKSISIEAAEILECFQWDDKNFNLANVTDEVADVLNYCLQMCIVLNLDPVTILNQKLDKTEKKYPVEKAKGVATKYTEL